MSTTNPINSKITSKISILIDYAHEPESMKLLLGTLSTWRENNFFDYVIHIVSCDGAGRDLWKKPILGKISHQNADFTVATLDNYDERDNPEEILDLITRDFDKKQHLIQYEKTENRREAFEIAIKKAIQISNFGQKKVIICSTGVGCENGLTHPKGKIDWNEKEIWTEIFNQFG